MAGIALLLLGGIQLMGNVLEESPDDAAAVTTITTVTVPAGSDTTVSTTTVPATTVAPGPGGTEFVTVTDDSGRLTVWVPAAWTDISGGGWTVQSKTVGLSLSVATDRASWYEGWDTPGVFIGVTTVPEDVYAPEFVDFSGACTFQTIEDRDTGEYAALIEHWTDCGAEDSDFYAVIARPESSAYTALLQLVVVDGGGAELLDTLLTTLSYDA